MVKILIVGDIMLGELPECYGHGVKTKIEESGIDHPFQYVKKIFKKSDLIVGNLECVLSNKSDKKWPESYFVRGKPEFAKGLKNAGFKVMNVANNHIMDHGLEAFTETLRALNENGIQYFGATSNGKRQEELFKYPLKDLDIGFLGYSLEHSRFCYIDYNYLDKIKKRIKEWKKDVDVLIMSLHWGSEYMNYPSYQQVKMARSLIDAGIDIVVGHHPHVAQGIERYNEGLTAYSLGNFVFDMYRQKTKESFILSLNISSAAKITQYDILPVSINKSFQPMPVENKKDMQRYIDTLCEKIADLEFENDNNMKGMKGYYFNARKESNINRICIRLHILRKFYKFPTSFLKYYLIKEIENIKRKKQKINQKEIFLRCNSRKNHGGL